MGGLDAGKQITTHNTSKKLRKKTTPVVLERIIRLSPLSAKSTERVDHRRRNEFSGHFLGRCLFTMRRKTRGNRGHPQ